MRLEEFVEAPGREHWVREPGVLALIGRARRVCESAHLLCLEVIEVRVELSRRRRGLFKSMLARCEQLAKTAGYDAVLVDNVVNDHLRGYLVEQGYRVADYTLGRHDLAHSYFIRVAK